MKWRRARLFRGDTGAEVFSSILRDAPAELPATVSGALAAIVERCLQKDPARVVNNTRPRPVTRLPRSIRLRPVGRRRGSAFPARAAAPAAALVAVAAVVVWVGPLWRTSDTGAIKLARLFFENLTGDPDQEYFSDGLTEDMIYAVRRLHPQRPAVIARTSSMRYKKSWTSRSIRRAAFPASTTLEGSARKEAGA